MNENVYKWKKGAELSIILMLWNIFQTKPNPACFRKKFLAVIKRALARRRSGALGGCRKAQLGCLSQTDGPTGNST